VDRDGKVEEGKTEPVSKECGLSKEEGFCVHVVPLTRAEAEVAEEGREGREALEAEDAESAATALVLAEPEAREGREALEAEDAESAATALVLTELGAADGVLSPWAAAELLSTFLHFRAFRT
jgi:hypothetical protein